MGNLYLNCFNNWSAKKRLAKKSEIIKEKIILPFFTKQTFAFGEPFPLPIRTSLGFDVNTKSGKINNLYLKEFSRLCALTNHLKILSIDFKGDKVK